MPSFEPLRAIEVSWRLEPYSPLPTEYSTLGEWRSAVRANDQAVRLTKLTKSADSPNGHYVRVSSYKIPLDPVTSFGLCSCCKAPIAKDGVAAGGHSCHKKCLPGEVLPGMADDLLLFAEEVRDVRPITAFLGLVR